MMMCHFASRTRFFVWIMFIGNVENNVANLMLCFSGFNVHLLLFFCKGEGMEESGVGGNSSGKNVLNLMSDCPIMSERLN